MQSKKSNQGVLKMYNIFEITFYKCDDDGEPITDSKGNIKLYNPKGRWKSLEYLCEDVDDNDFEEIKDNE